MIKCLCSNYTIDVFNQFKLSVKLSEYSLTEKFVFIGLFGYVRLMNREELEHQAFPLREHLLPSIVIYWMYLSNHRMNGHYHQ